MENETPLNTMQDAHLLVVDDDDRIRELLKRFLGRNGFRVSTAANTVEARHLMKSLAFDLLVLDVMMPGEDGFSLTQALRKIDNIPIILLTARGAASDRIKGLKLGADDYLSKPFEPEELVLRIKSILKRQSTQPRSHKIKFGDWVFDVNRNLLTQNGVQVHLTTGENVLLSTFARSIGSVINRHALAQQIQTKSERAVDVQITRLRRKLEPDPANPVFLVTVRNRGYRLQAEPYDE